jgi:glutathione reductase (NADPH)
VKQDDGSLVVVDHNGIEVVCDAVLYATGRKGKVDGLNLHNVGVQTKDSFIPVNEYSQTNVPSIYAVGDITNRMALTPVALMEGHRLADTLFGGKDRPVDHEYVASTVFTTPEIGTVGYTEEEAVAKFGDIDVFKNRFRAMKHSFPKSETYSLFKLIVETKTQRVVGCHVATDGAGEMVQGVAIAIKMGATKEDFDNTIGIHPTSAEELVTMRSPSYYYRDGEKIDSL